MGTRFVARGILSGCFETVIPSPHLGQSTPLFVCGALTAAQQLHPLKFRIEIPSNCITADGGSLTLYVNLLDSEDGARVDVKFPPSLQVATIRRSNTTIQIDALFRCGADVEPPRGGGRRLYRLRVHGVQNGALSFATLPSRPFSMLTKAPPYAQRWRDVERESERAEVMMLCQLASDESSVPAWGHELPSSVALSAAMAKLQLGASSESEAPSTSGSKRSVSESATADSMPQSMLQPSAKRARVDEKVFPSTVTPVESFTAIRLMNAYAYSALNMLVAALRDNADLLPRAIRQVVGMWQEVAAANHAALELPVGVLFGHSGPQSMRDPAIYGSLELPRPLTQGIVRQVMQLADADHSDSRVVASAARAPFDHSYSWPVVFSAEDDGICVEEDYGHYAGLYPVTPLQAFTRCVSGRAGCTWKGRPASIKALRVCSVDSFNESQAGRYWQIVHPNIARVQCVYRVPAGAANRYCCLVTEPLPYSVAGAFTMSDQIISSRDLEFLHDLASALACMHEQELTHGDLCPNNIMLDANSVIKLVPIPQGLVDAAPPVSLYSDTSRYHFVGPDLPMAALRGPGPSGDIFSFGMLVYAILAGREPSLADLANEGSVFDTPRDYNMPDGPISRDIMLLLRACLSLDARMRPTAGYVVMALSCLLQGRSLPPLRGVTVPRSEREFCNPSGEMRIEDRSPTLSASHELDSPAVDARTSVLVSPSLISNDSRGFGPPDRGGTGAASPVRVKFALEDAIADLTRAFRRISVAAPHPLIAWQRCLEICNAIDDYNPAQAFMLAARILREGVYPELLETSHYAATHNPVPADSLQPGTSVRLLRHLIYEVQLRCCELLHGLSRTSDDVVLLDQNVLAWLRFPSETLHTTVYANQPKLVTLEDESELLQPSLVKLRAAESISKFLAMDAWKALVNVSMNTTKSAVGIALSLPLELKDSQIVAVCYLDYQGSPRPDVPSDESYGPTEKTAISVPGRGKLLSCRWKGSDAVIKVFRSHIEEKAFRAFLNNRASASDDNIAHVYCGFSMSVADVPEGKVKYCLVMERLQYSLAALLGSHTVLQKTALSVRVKWLHEIALGISCAHGRGLIHGDLNPQKIMFDQYGAAKLIGLGEVVSLGYPAEEVMKKRALRYTSPELQTTIDEAGSHSDIYSFGMLARAVISGHEPNDDDSAFPTFPGSDALVQLIKQCTSKHPEARPRAAEVMQRLAAIVDAPRDLEVVPHADSAPQELSSALMSNADNVSTEYLTAVTSKDSIILYEQAAGFDKKHAQFPTSVVAAPSYNVSAVSFMRSAIPTADVRPLGAYSNLSGGADVGERAYLTPILEEVWRVLGLIVIILIGATGTGKSSLANLFVRELGFVGDPPFRPSDGVGSNRSTDEPQGVVAGRFLIIDSPGLSDSRGVAQDEANMQRMVAFLRRIGVVHAFAYVLNEQSPRFDASLQDTVKLFTDSFGPGQLVHSCFLYSHSLGTKSLERATRDTADCAALIAAKTGLPQRHIPFWRFDVYPEELAAMGVSDERIAARHASNREEIAGFVRWVGALGEPLPTVDAVPAETDDRRARREAEERAAAEAARRVYEASVISESMERRDVECGSHTHDAGHNVQRIFYTEWKSVMVTRRHYRSEQRVVKTYGSGVQSFGEWTPIAGTEYTI